MHFYFLHFLIPARFFIILFYPSKTAVQAAKGSDLFKLFKLLLLLLTSSISFFYMYSAAQR